MKIKQSRTEISIGEMRNVVILMPPTQTTGFNTTVTYPEEDWITEYAKVIPSGDHRKLQEANLTYNKVITVYIRYREGFGVRWKIKYDDKIFTLHEAENVSSVRRFIKILAYCKTT